MVFKKSLRIIALALALVLCLSIVPVTSASAASNTGKITLGFRTTGSDSVVKLTASQKSNVKITITLVETKATKTYTLADLFNGTTAKTITATFANVPASYHFNVKVDDSALRFYNVNLSGCFSIGHPTVYGDGWAGGSAEAERVRNINNYNSPYVTPADDVGITFEGTATAVAKSTLNLTMNFYGDRSIMTNSAYMNNTKLVVYEKRNGKYYQIFNVSLEIFYHAGSKVSCRLQNGYTYKIVYTYPSCSGYKVSYQQSFAQESSKTGMSSIYDATSGSFEFTASSAYTYTVGTHITVSK